ncbi:hypothetical protein CLCR_11251 [Cladophialophora carrionii]|uniref:Uncharacterized protein n=1 Tax=Cladophialophora carrionii TaxID=86049 RepID=A0A1C1CDG3_9EURO|nr:hypothetical protein CLCR_11251 [Cladophialophora carrionii]
MHHGTRPFHPQGWEPLVGVGKGHKPPDVELKPGGERLKSSLPLVSEVDTPLENVEGEVLPRAVVGLVPLLGAGLELDVVAMRDEAASGGLLDDDTRAVMMVLMTVTNVVDDQSTVPVNVENTFEKEVEPDSPTLEEPDIVEVDDTVDNVEAEPVDKEELVPEADDGVEYGGPVLGDWRLAVLAKLDNVEGEPWLGVAEIDVQAEEEADDSAETVLLVDGVQLGEETVEVKRNNTVANHSWTIASKTERIYLFD